MSRSLATLLLFSGAALGFSQTQLMGPGQYPAFRTLSGLPGGGYGLRPDGTPGFDGAMAFSTPLGYAISGWHVALTGANTSNYGWLRLPHLSGLQNADDSLGKLALTTGTSLGKFGTVSGTLMVISSQKDTATNFVYQAPLFYKNLGLAAGVQDSGGTRGDRAGMLPGVQSSRSFFVAATVPFNYGIYASAAIGTRRFEHGSANVSVPIGNRFKAVLEHDGFGVNEAIAWDPRAFGSYKLLGRNVNSTFMVGFVRSEYAFWSVNVSF